MKRRSHKRTRNRTATVGRWFTPSILLLGAGTALSAGVLALGLTWPATNAPLTLAAQHEQRADLALQNGAGSADFEIAARENAKTLATSPMTASAWLRAAYIRKQASGSLDAESLRDLEASYLVAPLGPNVSRWRLRFVFENWQSLTPAIRSAALNELRVFAAYHTGSRSLADSIENPAGRMAAKLTLRRAYMNMAAIDTSTHLSREAKQLEM